MVSLVGRADGLARRPCGSPRSTAPRRWRFPRRRADGLRLVAGASLGAGLMVCGSSLALSSAPAARSSARLRAVAGACLGAVCPPPTLVVAVTVAGCPTPSRLPTARRPAPSSSPTSQRWASTRRSATRPRWTRAWASSSSRSTRSRRPKTVNNFVFLAAAPLLRRRRSSTGSSTASCARAAIRPAPAAAAPATGSRTSCPSRASYELGSLAMANAGPNTNGSQFFIISGPEGVRLPPQYSLFGKVVKGLDVVERMQSVATDRRTAPGGRCDQLGHHHRSRLTPRWHGPVRVPAAGPRGSPSRPRASPTRARRAGSTGATRRGVRPGRPHPDRLGERAGALPGAAPVRPPRAPPARPVPDMRGRASCSSTGATRRRTSPSPAPAVALEDGPGRGGAGVGRPGSPGTGAPRLRRERLPRVVDRARSWPASCPSAPSPKGTWWDWDHGKHRARVPVLDRAVSARRRSNIRARVRPPRTDDARAASRRPDPVRGRSPPGAAGARPRAARRGTVRDLADYYRLHVRMCRPRLAELVEEGRLVPVQVEGWKEPAYLDAAARARGGSGAGRCCRRSTRWCGSGRGSSGSSASTTGSRSTRPAPKRGFGYYVLPFLLGEDLVARVDLKADRKAQHAAGAGRLRRAGRAARGGCRPAGRGARAAGGVARPGPHRRGPARRPRRGVAGRARLSDASQPGSFRRWPSSCLQLGPSSPSFSVVTVPQIGIPAAEKTGATENEAAVEIPAAQKTGATQNEAAVESPPPKPVPPRTTATVRRPPPRRPAPPRTKATVSGAKGRSCVPERT